MKKVVLNFISLIFVTSLAHPATCGSCAGCSFFWTELTRSADEIDERHRGLEEKLDSYYKSKIIPLLQDVELLHLEVTRLTAHIELMNKEAANDEKKIIVYLKKSLRHNIEQTGGKK